MKFISKWAWIGAIVFGIALLASGAVMVRQARMAHTDVRDALAGERIVTSEKADIPLAPVTNAATAKAQADVIQSDVLAITGGKTYAELDRSDPARTTYLNAVTLRSALMESYLAFKVADLVLGIGLIIVMLGLSHIALGTYLGLKALAPEEAETVPAAKPAKGTTALGGI